MEAWNQNSWEDPCDPWIILNIMVIVIMLPRKFNTNIIVMMLAIKEVS